MDDLTVEKIEQSRRDRKRSHSLLAGKSRSYPHFLELEKAAFAPGELTSKVKELMALSISIVTRCEPCMEWHVEQAVLSGASEAEIYEAIDVATEMGGGPAVAYARFALRSYEYFLDRQRTSGPHLREAASD